MVHAPWPMADADVSAFRCHDRFTGVEAPRMGEPAAAAVDF